MKIVSGLLIVFAAAFLTGDAHALPSGRPEPAHLRWVPDHHTRLAKFKKEDKRIVPDTMQRSTLHKINQLRKDKRKRKHYKKDAQRTPDKRNPASDRKVHPRFSRKGLSEEQIQHYMDRYRERQRLREKYDKMSEER